MSRWVLPLAEARGLPRELLGGKAYGLAELAAAGLPVPPGFVILTSACDAFHDRGREPIPGLSGQIHAALAQLERDTGRRFGDAEDPLLVSVRSGAPQSMPGMLDTVLNLGVTPSIAATLGAATGQPAFGLDTERRFLSLFGNVVLGLPAIRFSHQVREARVRAGLLEDDAWTLDALAEVLSAHRETVDAHAGSALRHDPPGQLFAAVRAIHDSWFNERAAAYRRQRELADRPGTAVVVQAMVFGNRGPDSGTGVVFTRNPASGERSVYGEYLLDAQGEDLVAGLRTPQPISALEADLPPVYAELLAVAAALERQFGDVQDIEFTIEAGRLYLLQTRAAMRTADAAVRIAVELAQEGLIDREEAVGRVSTDQLAQLLAGRFDDDERAAAIGRGALLGQGLPASPGAATGPVAFDTHTAERMAEAGTPAILVREETSPDDVPGMMVAAGMLTARGGATSHAAVVARDLGVPCVVACAGLEVDPDDGLAMVGGRAIEAETVVSIDGTTGEVFAGALRRSSGELSDRPQAQTLMGWVDALARGRTDAGAPPEQRLTAAHAALADRGAPADRS